MYLSSSHRLFMYSHFKVAFPVRDFINKLIEILIIYNEINPVKQFSPFPILPFVQPVLSYLALPSSTGLRLYCLISRFAFRFSRLLWLLFSLPRRPPKKNATVLRA